MRSFISLSQIRPGRVSIRLSDGAHIWPSTSVDSTIDGRITVGNELPAARRRRDLSVIRASSQLPPSVDCLETYITRFYYRLEEPIM